MTKAGTRMEIRSINGEYPGSRFQGGKLAGAGGGKENACVCGIAGYTGDSGGRGILMAWRLRRAMPTAPQPGGAVKGVWCTNEEGTSGNLERKRHVAQTHGALRERF